MRQQLLGTLGVVDVIWTTNPSQTEQTLFVLLDAASNRGHTCCFDHVIDDQIFGLSVSARWNSDIFQIWNMNSALKENTTVMKKVAEILKGVEIQSPFYKGMFTSSLLSAWCRSSKSCVPIFQLVNCYDV